MAAEPPHSNSTAAYSVPTAPSNSSIFLTGNRTAAVGAGVGNRVTTSG